MQRSARSRTPSIRLAEAEASPPRSTPSKKRAPKSTTKTSNKKAPRQKRKPKAVEGNGIPEEGAAADGVVGVEDDTLPALGDPEHSDGEDDKDNDAVEGGDVPVMPKKGEPAYQEKLRKYVKQLKDVNWTIKKIAQTLGVKQEAAKSVFKRAKPKSYAQLDADIDKALLLHNAPGLGALPEHAAVGNDDEGDNDGGTEGDATATPKQKSKPKAKPKPALVPYYINLMGGPKAAGETGSAKGPHPMSKQKKIQKIHKLIDLCADAVDSDCRRWEEPPGATPPRHLWLRITVWAARRGSTRGSCICRGGWNIGTNQGALHCAH
ncbi:hypothetical protein OAO87_00890 [bacterium]|nr:hypothetical protein [bacterium]